MPGSCPYMVTVFCSTGEGHGFFCSGTLISPYAVMTAAQCVVSTEARIWFPPTWVDNDTGGQCDGDIVYHPKYTEPEGATENDVTIVFLSTAITNVTPVMLNDDPNVPQSGSPLDVSG